MQLSLPPTTVSVSISLGERRSIHSSARPISLGLGVAGAGRSLYSQSTPYPSPPMSSSPPPDSLTPSRHSTQDASQERRHSVNPTASLLPALRHVETSPSLSSIGAGGHTAHDAQMTISSPVRRSPFVAQNTQLNQPQRRTKSHVASACVNCKKAHLACDGM